MQVKLRKVDPETRAMFEKKAEKYGTPDFVPKYQYLWWDIYDQRSKLGIWKIVLDVGVTAKIYSCKTLREVREWLAKEVLKGDPTKDCQPPRRYPRALRGTHDGRVRVVKYHYLDKGVTRPGYRVESLTERWHDEGYFGSIEDPHGERYKEAALAEAQRVAARNGYTGRIEYIEEDPPHEEMLARRGMTLPVKGA